MKSLVNLLMMLTLASCGLKTLSFFSHVTHEQVTSTCLEAHHSQSSLILRVPSALVRLSTVLHYITVQCLERLHRSWWGTLITPIAGDINVFTKTPRVIKVDLSTTQCTGEIDSIQIIVSKNIVAPNVFGFPAWIKFVLFHATSKITLVWMNEWFVNRWYWQFSKL